MVTAMAMAMVTETARTSDLQLSKKRTKRRTTLVRALLVASFTFMAMYLALASAATQVFLRPNPTLANKVWPSSGYAASRLADVIIDKSRAANPNAGENFLDSLDGNQTNLVERLSTQSFLADPINASAIRNLALVKEKNGHTDQAARLFNLGGQFSRRDIVIGDLQLRQAMAAGDLRKSLTLLDRMLRVHVDVRARFLPVLAKAMEHPDLEDTMVNILKPEPNWETEFWQVAIAQKNVSSNIGGLREAIVKHRGIELLPHIISSRDRQLLDALIRSQQFDSAQSLNNVLLSNNKAQSDAGGSYGQPTDMQFHNSPFDLQLKCGEEACANLNDAGTKVILDVDGSSIGTFASRLVNIPNPPAKLSVRAASVPGVSFFTRLKCVAGTSKLSPVEVSLRQSDNSGSVSLPTACRWYRAEFWVKNDTGETVTLDIAGLSIGTPVS